MKRFLLLLGAIGAFMLQAQQFEVVETQQINTDGAYYHPQFMPDGQSILVTSESFDGLGIVDLATSDYKQITTMPGAGYMPAIQNDGNTVVVRSNDVLLQKISLYAIDIDNLKSRQLGLMIDHVNRLNVVDGDVHYAINGAVKTSQVLPKNKLKKVTNEPSIYVTEEDLKVVLYNNGIRTVIDPLSTPDNDVNYCWSSISPDKTKILFVGGNNAYTCNLDGSGLVNLGALHAPVWKGNGHVVGMEDEDDGHVFTKSDIVIMDVNGNNRQQLTKASGEIKMYPAVSADGQKIAYHTTDGKIYLMTIKEK